MDGQHGLPVVGPAVRSASVAKAVRVELWRPRVDDGANAVALKKMLDVVGRGGTWWDVVGRGGKKHYRRKSRSQTFESFDNMET